METREVPAWFNEEIQRVSSRLSIEYARYTKSEMVIPVSGSPFWRKYRRNGVPCEPGTAGAEVWYKYLESHEEWGSQEFRAPSRWITDGRFVIYQDVNGKKEKLVSLVEDTGEPLQPDTRTLMFLAQNAALWENVTAYDAAVEAAEAERMKAADTLLHAAMDEPYEELVRSRNREHWVMLNDAARKNGEQTEIKVTDKRRFLEPEPAAATE